jgi:hypothetical protein
MRIILDTNVWSRLVDADQIEEFAELEKARELKVVVPPSTLLEAAKTPKAEIRDRLVVAIAGRGRIHPPTEASEESRELVEEVRRLRPGWLRGRPKTDRLSTLQTFWTRRIWDWARRDPAGFAREMAEHDRVYGKDRLIDELAEDQRQQRLSNIETGFEMSGRVAPRATAWPHESDPDGREGWDGAPLDAWRLETASMFWQNVVVLPARAWLTGEGTTFADWVVPWLNRDRLSASRADWNRFFYYEVSAASMPRNWLRSTVRFAQWGMKVSHGNPVDEQHAAYLPDGDLFLTGDTRFHSLLKDIIPFAPARLAQPRLVPADARDVVAALETAIEGFDQEPDKS